MATVTLGPAASDSSGGYSVKRYGTCSATVNSSDVANCDVIDIRGFKDIAVKPPASVTAVTVYAAESAGGTFVIVDSIGTSGAVTVTASKWNVLDVTKIGPFGFIKLKSTGADGTAVIVGKT